MITPEEQARANLYGLLARLFYAPPDAAALATPCQGAAKSPSSVSPAKALRSAASGGA